MWIGIPREIKDHEYRVALMPDAVRILTQAGHTVLVETDAGKSCGAPDENYIRAGARIVSNPRELFKNARLIVKVKEPLPWEYNLIRPDHIVFTFFHFASNAELTDAMRASGAVCIAYETMESADGRLPLLEPMSEIAGRLAAQEGAGYLEANRGGSGILLGGAPGVEPGRVLVIGGGIVGTAAARVAAGLGARVLILDVNETRLREIASELPGVETRLSSDRVLRDILGDFDLVVGAVLVRGGRTPRLITRDMLKKMRPGSVIVDVGIDQGGCLETSRAGSWREPVYTVDGILHFCVPNLPGAVPRTAAPALSNVVSPWVVRLADAGWEQTAAKHAEIQGGLSIVAGEIVHPMIASDQNQVRKRTSKIQAPRISA